MEANYFTILWWFLPYIDMNQPRVYMCLPVLNLPPNPIPWSCPSTLALSALFHALNLDWSSISHMVIYMFQCYSLKSSHPCLLSQSPKVYSLNLCLFFCLAYRIVITIFLNSIYMRLLYWCFSFWHTSLCIIGYKFVHVIRSESQAFFFMAE